jgi:phosphoribosylanthranilate isomerase
MPTRVKICGITRPEDASYAAELGAAYLGINTFNGPRQADPAFLKTVRNALPREIPIVALTDAYGIKGGLISGGDQLLDAGASFLQLYLSETLPAGFLPARATNWWLVARIGARADFRGLHARVTRMPSFLPGGLLLDTASEKLGGTGQSFNWHWIAEARDAGELEGLPPIILAGGLTPDNVAEAIRIAKPYAVDVSSGVEIPGKPGIKDPVKIRDFIQAAKNAL